MIILERRGRKVEENAFRFEIIKKVISLKIFLKAVVKTILKHHLNHGPEYYCAPYPIYSMTNDIKYFPSIRR